MSTPLTVEIGSKVDASLERGFAQTNSHILKVYATLMKLEHVTGGLHRFFGQELVSDLAKSTAILIGLNRALAGLSKTGAAGGAGAAGTANLAATSANAAAGIRTFTTSITGATIAIAGLVVAIQIIRELALTSQADAAAASGRAGLGMTNARLKTAVQQRLIDQLQSGKLTSAQAAALRDEIRMADTAFPGSGSTKVTWDDALWKKSVFQGLGPALGTQTGPTGTPVAASPPGPEVVQQRLLAILAKTGGFPHGMKPDEIAAFRAEYGHAETKLEGQRGAIGDEEYYRQRRFYLERAAHDELQAVGMTAEKELAIEWQLQNDLEKLRQEQIKGEGDALKEIMEIHEEDAQATKESLAQEWADRQEHYQKVNLIAKESAETRKQAEQMVLGASANMLGSFASLAQSFGRRGFVAWKALAIGQALVSAILGALMAKTQALALPPPTGLAIAPWMFGMHLAAGLANVAQIAATQPPSYSVGGYTGDGARNEPAGTVHRGEFVVSAPVVQRLGLPSLEALNSGRVGAGPIQVALFDDRAKLDDWLRNGRGRQTIVDTAGAERHQFT